MKFNKNITFILMEFEGIGPFACKDLKEIFLTNTEARGPGKDPVSWDLNDEEERDEDPVLQPPLIILRVLAQHRLDAHVARVDTDDETDEHVTAITSHNTHHRQYDQTCNSQTLLTQRSVIIKTNWS